MHAPTSLTNLTKHRAKHPGILIVLILIACLIVAGSILHRISTGNQTASTRMSPNTATGHPASNIPGQDSPGANKPIGGIFNLEDAAGNGFTIRLQRYFAFATPVGYYDQSFGTQVAAAYITATGTGPSAAKVMPATEAAVVDGSGHSFSARSVPVAECTPAYPPALIYLSRGQTDSGCVTFQMPIGIRITSITFTLSGTTNTVTWNL